MNITLEHIQIHFLAQKNAEKSLKCVKNEIWNNLVKVPIGTSRVLIKSCEVPIVTSTVPIGTNSRIFPGSFFLSLKLIKSFFFSFFFVDKPHPISCLLTFKPHLAYFSSNQNSYK